MTEHRGFIDAFWLKIIMAALMVLDHIYYDLFPDTLLWGHIAARVVAPVFCYLMTEGLVYTRNRFRYLRRMLVFALAMLVGNGVLYWMYGRWIQNSIIMELAIGAAMITCIDLARERPGKARWLCIAAIAALAVASLYFEGSYMIPMMALIFYYLRERPLAMWVTFFMAYSANYLYYYLVLDYELMPAFWVCLSIIPILCYSGKRGHSGPFAKYFFYVFYPLHIWIIFLVEQAVLYGGLHTLFAR